MHEIMKTLPHKIMQSLRGMYAAICNSRQAASTLISYADEHDLSWYMCSNILSKHAIDLRRIDRVVREAVWSATSPVDSVKYFCCLDFDIRTPYRYDIPLWWQIIPKSKRI